MTSQYMREALDLARKGRSLASPNPAGRRDPGARRRSRGPRLPHLRRAQTRRNPRARAGRRAGARRHPLSQSGTLLAPGPHAALRRRADPRRRRARRRAPSRPQPAGRRQGFADCARPASKSKSPRSSPPKPRNSTSPSSTSCAPAARWSPSRPPITLDGKISAPDDNRGWITSERARAHVQNSATITTPSSPASAPCSPTIACSPTAPAIRAAARSCASCWIPCSACRSNPKWCAAPRRRAGGHHFRRVRRTPQAARIPRRPGAGLRRPRRPRRPAQRRRVAGPRSDISRS